MTPTPQSMYTLLLNHFGHQEWWPVDEQYHRQHRSDPRFEIIIGAILTQNTAWTNVERALTNLKHHNCVTVQNIRDVSEEKLRNLIQPSGFFNQKAHRLKIVANHLSTKYNNDLTMFFSQEGSSLRSELLALKGIGPETADSMLLYAGKKPFFVVDAYTKRICQRLPLPVSKISYDAIQTYFEEELKKHYHPQKIVFIFKELHALIVELAKNYCKKNPRCQRCPLSPQCEQRLLK